MASICWIHQNFGTHSISNSQYFFIHCFFLFLQLPWTRRPPDPSCLWYNLSLFNCIGTLWYLSSFYIKSLALLGTTFFKPIKSLKKCMDLQPTKPSKCNSYLAYHLRKSIAINFSLPQCMRLLVRWHLQLLGGSLTFHLINLFFLILSVCRYTVGNSHLLFSLFCRFNQVISF